MLYLNRLKWPLRKIMLPVSGSGLVLDVGSGGRPYPRSDVLMDRMTGAEHRCGESMMIDRPVVFGDASKMPFKDKAFDFIVASHILEHMADPEIFLKELQRVGKAGYIETPNAIFERLHPYGIHCLEVLEKDGILYINKKNRHVQDPFLGTKNMLDDDTPWGRLMYEKPHMFHVRYFWSDEIKYEISNPDVSADWIEEINAQSEAGESKDCHLADNSGWRAWGLTILNWWQKKMRARRLKNFDLLSILACPECGGELDSKSNSLACGNCKVAYPYTDGIPEFTTVIDAPS